MDDAEVVAAIGSSFLGGLPVELVERLLAVGSRLEVPARSTVYRELGAPQTLLVVRGLLRVYLASPEGRQVTVRYARDSDVLGIAVLVGGPVGVGVQSIVESTLFRIDTETLNATAHRDGRVAWALAEELSRRLYESLQQTAINTFGSVRQRVAAHLLDLASAQQRPRGGLIAEVSQQELADAVGSVREVVARDHQAEPGPGPDRLSLPPAPHDPRSRRGESGDHRPRTGPQPDHRRDAQ